MNKANTETIVGNRLRDLRLKHGLSLRALAAESGLNVNTLSLIENNKTSPSVSTLQLISNALGVQITSFFEQDSQQTHIAHHRSGERSKSTYMHGTLEDLAAGIEMQCGKPLLVTLNPRTSSGSVPIVHTGYEFIYCIKNHFFYTVEKQTYLLTPGDSLLFEAHLPHCWQNPGVSPAQLLMIICPADKNENPIERHFISD